MEELWTSRHKIFKITKNTWVSQEKLLMARNKKWYQKICSKIYEISTKQSTAHEKS